MRSLVEEVVKVALPERRRAVEAPQRLARNDQVRDQAVFRRTLRRRAHGHQQSFAPDQATSAVALHRAGFLRFPPGPGLRFSQILKPELPREGFPPDAREIIAPLFSAQGDQLSPLVDQQIR